MENKNLLYQMDYDMESLAEYQDVKDFLPEDPNDDHFNVIIAGGRDFKDYETLYEECNRILENYITFRTVHVISGTAKGADCLGERFAKERNLHTILMPAQWKRYGKSAGVKRNEEMAKIADAAIIFWDGKSRGTKNMIDQAEKKGIRTYIYNY